MRLIDADALLAEIEKNEGASDMPEQWYRGVWFVKWHIKTAKTIVPYNLDNHEADSVHVKTFDELTGIIDGLERALRIIESAKTEGNDNEID